MATLKFIQLIAGLFSEVRTLEVSTGASDATKIPNTNAAGVLDPSLLNATAVSAGSGDASKIPKLDASGKLDATFMPIGITADLKIITASEALAAGALVNTYLLSGALRARNADQATGRAAHGYVIAAVASGSAATVYFEGTNNAVTARTIGANQWLGAAGAMTETPPTAPGISQLVGAALSATEVPFSRGDAVTLAA